MTRVELPLAEACAGCGRCCESIGLPPFEAANPAFGPQRVSTRHLTANQIDDAAFDTELFLLMPTELREAHAQLLLNLTTNPNGQACAWYDTVAQNCKHYTYRPATCRRFEEGDTRCLNLQADANVQLVWELTATVEQWQNPRMPRAFGEPVA